MVVFVGPGIVSSLGGGGRVKVFGSRGGGWVTVVPARPGNVTSLGGGGGGIISILWMLWKVTTFTDTV
jgi:hypothetical protein